MSDTPYPCVQWIFRFFFGEQNDLRNSDQQQPKTSLPSQSMSRCQLALISSRLGPPTKSRGKCAWRAHAGCRLRRHRLGPGTGERPGPAPVVYAPAGWPRTGTGTRPTRARHLIRIRRPRSTVGSPFVRGVAVRGHGECSAVAWHRHRVSPVAAQCGGSGGSVARPRCTCRMSTTCVAVRPCWAQRVECPCHSASHGIHSSSFGWNSGTASSASRLRVMEY